ncbi:MAG: 2-polyprenyl-3-methyl-6-methoxy-1,4-benzoquinone monooxygenase [Chromatiales bacterium]|jgi:ubiquinone biosynthesis monooxygenase Coq7
MTQRDYSPVDQLFINLDQGIRTLFGKPKITERYNPAENIEETEMTDAVRDHTARLMRINHTGEVCAQALYQGQALTAKLPQVRDNMERAAAEENDHLDWCESRLKELGNRTSYLNPFWYVSSFAIGAAAGLAGDKWSLGFVGETERQVEGHLEGHLQQVPETDQKTRAILEQMKIDEIEHGNTAMRNGGAQLPAPIKLAMKITSKFMTGSVYYL